MVLWMGEGDAYALLHDMLRTEYNLESRLELAREPGGKPYLVSHPGLQINLSHSGGWALCGAGAVPLGVDLERVRPRRAGLARYACSEAEYAWFQQLGGDWDAFYTIWTLKEARVKCTGEGLRRPPCTISVPRIRPGEWGERDGLYFASYAGEGWRAGVCSRAGETPPDEIRFLCAAKSL